MKKKKDQFFDTQSSLLPTSPIRWTFVGKVKSLLFNTLPRFVIAVLPRSKHLLI